jgi:type IV secretory pathway VirB3-like protein
MIKMNQSWFLEKSRLQYWVFFLIVFISRLPFINSGYGYEEDSWGMMNAMQRMAGSGKFEISRFPGHPVLEFVYSLMPFAPYFMINVCTALVSSVGLVFFMALLKKYQIKKAFWYALALAFVPVVSIKSTDNMDYMWAVAFTIIAWYCLVRKYWYAWAIMLALAVASRFTAIVFLPASCLIMYYQYNLKWQHIVFYTMVCIATVTLCFWQVILHYNSSVYIVPYILGYPDVLKTVFKSSIGVWGVLGCVASLAMLFSFFTRKAALQKHTIWAIGFALVFALLLFIWQPHKAAYLIVALPFFFFLWAAYSNGKHVVLIALLLVASNFLCGIYLNDNYRGNKSNGIVMHIAGQSLSFDLFKGPLIAEHEKRNKKLAFVYAVIDTLPKLKQPFVILSGWYTNELEVIARSKNININCEYFITPELLRDYKQKSITVYYLPQQDAVNDLRWQTNTKKMALPLYHSNTPFIF